MLEILLSLGLRLVGVRGWVQRVIYVIHVKDLMLDPHRFLKVPVLYDLLLSIEEVPLLLITHVSQNLLHHDLLVVREQQFVEEQLAYLALIKHDSLHTVLRLNTCGIILYVVLTLDLVLIP